MSNPTDSNFHTIQSPDCSIKILRFKNSDNIQLIEAVVDCDHLGIFGVCYPQTQDTVQKLCESEADRFYSDISYSHELGQQCVDIVLFGLNAIPNVKAWQTPSNSIADVVWKWDVIIEFENNFYPLQIKSGLDSVEKCQQLLAENISNKIEKLYNEIQSISVKNNRIIENLMKEYGYKTHKNATIFEIKEQQSQKIKKLEEEIRVYLCIKPLFLWSSRNKKALQDIIRLFSNLFTPNENPEELLQAAWISYQEIYKTAKKLLLIEQQEKYNLAKYLKVGLEKLQQTFQEYIETKRTKNLQEQKHINLGVKVEEISLNNLLYEVLQFSTHYENYCEIYLIKIEQYGNPDTFPDSVSLMLETVKKQIIKAIKLQQNTDNSQQGLRKRRIMGKRRSEAISSDNNIFNKSHQHSAKLKEVKQKMEKIDKLNQSLQFFKSEEIKLISSSLNQLLELKSGF
ncbi:hypothetical protein [Laspinema olomoucense]|uniref:hypothetical protein n=1 Tax=Laspinema olomoucense TaxID=3231600 RepID=UPI0021BB2DFB|nr:hypothetical protein [Laspinema sp. D3c]MCT7995313.1 hypothetical protein [Laspinema sp. D3c]